MIKLSTLEHNWMANLHVHTVIRPILTLAVGEHF